MNSTKLLTTPEQCFCKCPCCDAGILIKNINHLAWNDFEASVEGATVDCNNCNALLIINQQSVYPFHEWMHAKNPEWPADGKDTDFITLSPPSS